MAGTRRSRSLAARVAGLLFLTTVFLPKVESAGERAWLLWIVGVSVGSHAHAGEMWHAGDWNSIENGGFGYRC